METKDKDQTNLPFHTVMKYMMRDLKHKIGNVGVCEEDVRHVLKSVSTVLQVISSDELELPSETRHTNKDMLVSIVRDVCFPTIYALHHLPPSELGRSISLLSMLISACCQHLPEKTLPGVISQVIVPLCSFDSRNKDLLSLLNNDVYHQHKSQPLDKCFTLDLFGYLVSNQTLFGRYLSSLWHINVGKEQLLQVLFETIISLSQDECAFTKVFTVISKLLAHCPAALQCQCEGQVWQQFTEQPLNNHHQEKYDIWRSLYVFYCLKNYFFPLNESEKQLLSSKVGSNQFWSIVQSGLASRDSSHRKIAMYLMKRLVDTCNKNSCAVNLAYFEHQSDVSSTDKLPLFWWSPRLASKLSVIWEDFILLMETLEEKQVHIIKPLLSKMQKLISASSLPKNEFPMFHSSWLVAIVTRCFQHESHYMSRWGAHALLTIDFDKVPLIHHGQLKYLSHDLMIYLQENKLYSRYEGTELGKCSPVGEAIQAFFANIFHSLNKTLKVKFLRNVLTIVCDNNWGSIPLVFLFKGLSHIPSGPILEQELLHLLREILQSRLTTLEVLSRGAIECFICQTVINLIDLESVSLRDLFSTLAALNRNESLQRGSTLWMFVVNWLSSEAVVLKWSKKEITALALDYLRENVGEEDFSITLDRYTVITAARMLILYSDSLEQRFVHGKLLQSELDDASRTFEKSALCQVLCDIDETLTDIHSRSYIDTSRVNRSLSLLLSLCKEIRTFDKALVDGLVMKHVKVNFKNICHFVRLRLSQVYSQAGNLDHTKFYAEVLVSLGQQFNSCKGDLIELMVLVSKSLAMRTDTEPDMNLMEYDLLNTSAMKILSAVLRILSKRALDNGREENADIVSKVLEFINIMDVPIPLNRKSCNKEQISKAHVGRVVSSFISSKWKCLRYIFELWVSDSSSGHRLNGFTVDLTRVINDAMEDLSIGSGSSDVAIFEALEVIIHKLVDFLDSAVIVKLFEHGWFKVMEEGKNVRFWKKLKAFVPLALHSCVLLQDKASVIGLGADELLVKLNNLGEDKTGIMFLVFEHLIKNVLEGDADRRIAEKLIPILVDGSCIGTVHKRGERVWLDVCAYIESLGESCSVNQITSSASRNDLYTRVIILNWLSRLCPHIPADHKFVHTFLQTLQTKYISLAALTTYKQYANSFSHRQKHRMVLVFLLLVDFIDKSNSEVFVSMLWHALAVESHPSVRQMLEWLIMIIIIRFPDSVSCILDIFKLYNNKRSVCLCSLFLIISHLGTKLPSEMQEKYFSEMFTAVLPWTMAHHYNTRIFAQATLTCLWEQCQTLQLADVINQNSLVQSTIDFLFNNGNASGTVPKLLSIYMYRPFDPVTDLSMETIFQTLPKLACLADDEWISPKQFVQMDSSWNYKGQHLLPLMNSSNRLSLCKEGPWRMKAPSAGDDDDDINSMDGATAKDVQKKIMPWRQMSPNEDTEYELSSQRQKRPDGDLILVTSLIDKVPNLGGLCRTSEIFGVSEFVIGNLVFLEDRMFQNLSVSAQKWIKITEVMLPRLTEFLEEKRVQGYTLVGVEQTANSVSLESYKFPKKTLLLLGNEREGIPVDIIQLLDVCVEIPQLGIIRSLNVHVCGALIIWEYTRQHMKDISYT